MKLSARRYWIYFGLLIALLFVLEMSFFLFRESVLNPRLKVGKEVERQYDAQFVQFLNQLSIFYTSQRYGQVVSLSKNRLESSSSLSPRQKYILYYMTALGNMKLGFYNFGLDALEKAKLYEEDQWLYLLYGIIHEKMGDENTAEGDYRKASSYEKMYSLGYEKLGDLLFSQNRIEEAGKVYDKNIDYNDLGVLKSAVTDYFLGNYPKSLAKSKRYINFSEDRNVLRYATLLSALAYSAIGDVVEANNGYEAAVNSIGVGGDKGFFQYLYVNHLFAQSEDDKALGILARLMSDEQYGRESKLLLVKYYYDRKEYERCFKILSSSYSVEKNLPTEYLDYYAYSSFKLGRYTLSGHLADEMIRRRDNVDFMVDAHILKTLTYIQMGDPTKASGYILDLLDKNMDNKEIMNSAGYIALKYLDVATQEKVFGRIVQQAKNDEDLRIVSDYYIVSKKYNLAISLYLKKTTEQNQHYYYYKNLGDLYLKIGDFDQAEKYYLQGVQMDVSKDVAAKIYNNLAYVYGVKKDEKRFQEYLIKALEVGDREPMILYNVAMTFKKRDENRFFSYLREAEMLVERIPKKERNREFSKIYLELGFYYEKRKAEYPRASSYYKKTLELDPNENQAAYRFMKIRRF